MLVLGGVVEHFRARQMLTVLNAELERQGEKRGILAYAPVFVGSESNGAPLIHAAASVLSYLPDHDSRIPPPPVMGWVAPGVARVTWKEDALRFERYLSWDPITNLWKELRPYMETNRPALHRIHEGLKMPRFAFDIEWSKGLDFALRHPTHLKMAVRWLKCAASFEMRHGDFDQAHEHLLANVRLLRRWNNEPHWLSRIVRVGLISAVAASQWELLQYDGWTDAHLAEWQAEWQQIDLLSELADGIRLDRESAWHDIRKWRHDPREAHAVFRLFSDSTLPTYPQMFLHEPRETLSDTARALAWPLWTSYLDEVESRKSFQSALEYVARLELGRSWRAVASDFAALSNRVGRLAGRLPVTGGWGVTYTG